MKKRRALAIFMAIAMVFCYMPTTALADVAADATDVTVQAAEATPVVAVNALVDMPAEGFWSTAALKAAVSNGLLKGFTENDGTYIRPDEPLTRAQMATIVNRAFGASETAALSGVGDVSANEWYYKEMQKAVKMETMKLDTVMRPNDSITRQEAFTILARALKMNDGAKADLAKFNDASQVDSWATAGMGAMVKAGYIKGDNNLLTPTASMTRAQFATIMNNVIKQYITTPGTVTEVAAGNVMVNVPGVTLQDVTITGDLIIGDGVGDGTVNLKNVVVKGNLIARGGGVESIIITGGSVNGKVIIAKVDGKIRVFTENGAEIKVVEIDDGKDEVIIEGTVGTVEVTSKDTPVIIRNATVNKIEVNTEGASNITVDNKSKVNSLAVGASSTGTKIDVAGTVTNFETSARGTDLSGAGTVTNAKVNDGANNSKITTPKTVITNDGASGVTGGGGKDIPANSNATNNAKGDDLVATVSAGGGTAGSGGGGSEPVVPVPTPVIEWADTVITKVAKDEGTNHPPYQLMQINYKRNIEAESVVLTITDKSNSNKVYLTAAGAKTVRADGFFQWSYRDLSTLTEISTQADLDALERNNDHRIPVGAEMEIKITATKGDEKTVITTDYTMSQDDYNASTWPLTLQEAIDGAKGFTYDPVYTYKEGLTFDDNKYTGTYTWAETYLKVDGAETTKTVGDLARILGALNRQEGSSVTKITYDEKVYTWNKDGTRKGSNWETEGNVTLVSAITTNIATQLNMDSGSVNVVVKVTDGKDMKDLTFAITVAEKVNPTVEVSLPADGFVVGVAGEFTITTTANDYAGTMVIGNSTHNFDTAIEKLEYWHDGSSTWIILDGDFGLPGVGFPLIDGTSKFRVKFKEEVSGQEYVFKTNVVRVKDNVVLAEKVATFKVVPVIEWATVAITTVGVKENPTTDNPYQLMKINYKRNIVAESVKLTITDKTDFNKVYLTAAGGTDVRDDGFWQWSYRDLSSLTEESNQADLDALERNNDNRIPVGTELVITITATVNGVETVITKDYKITEDDFAKSAWAEI